ncbi:multidrug resistance-associated protein 1-like [Saccostrea cucullata]|uniref:multidrug resistance-associated protein 1-like n=1 Tax=Saccostrea cuccullata TaxID=36930 RepID=UPI002ED1DCDF
MNAMTDSIVDKIESFCSEDSLWDSNLTWNTASPDLTLCFQKTVLPWVPCTFILIFSPLRLYLLPNERTKQQHSTLSLAKYILCSGLLFLSFLECIEKVYMNSLDDAVRQPEFMSFILTAITLIMANHVMWTERQQKIRSSGFLLTFWFLMFVSFCLTLQSRVRSLLKQDDMNVDTRFCFLSIQTLLSIAQLTLTALFVDNFPEDDQKYKKPSSENSTFLSILSFSWFTSIVREAYRRTLKAEDMIELTDDITSESAVPIFQKAWRDEVNITKRSVC